jgi:hypothetical protein
MTAPRLSSTRSTATLRSEVSHSLAHRTQAAWLVGPLVIQATNMAQRSAVVTIVLRNLTVRIRLNVTLES